MNSTIRNADVRRGGRMEYRTYQARTVDEAITQACLALGVTSDRLEYDVTQEPTNGFLGIGSKPAVIRARVRSEQELQKEKTAIERAEEADQKAGVRKAPLRKNGRRLSQATKSRKGRLRQPPGRRRKERKSPFRSEENEEKMSAEEEETAGDAGPIVSAGTRQQKEKCGAAERRLRSFPMNRRSQSRSESSNREARRKRRN